MPDKLNECEGKSYERIYVCNQKRPQCCEHPGCAKQGGECSCCTEVEYAVNIDVIPYPIKCSPFYCELYADCEPWMDHEEGWTPLCNRRNENCTDCS